MQRFAGDDETRLAALHRVAAARPSVALATRGGYGLTRLLDRIDWKRIARSVEAGTRWVGMSDMTSLQLGLLAHAGGITWAGPLACDDFGRSDAEGGVDDVTEACFVEAMSGALEAVGFRTEAGLRRPRRSRHALGRQPRDRQLAAGDAALAARSRAASSSSRTSTSIRIASSGTCCSCTRPACSTRRRRSCSARSAAGASRRSTAATSLASMLARVRAATRTPILTGLPFGHVPTKVTLPVGARVRLVVDGRPAFIGWALKRQTNHRRRLRRRPSMLQAANGAGRATTVGTEGHSLVKLRRSDVARSALRASATGASGRRRPVQRGRATSRRAARLGDTLTGPPLRAHDNSFTRLTSASRAVHKIGT